MLQVIKFSFPIVVGDITQKGYEKKRAKLLARYIPLIQGMGSVAFRCCHNKHCLVELDTGVWM
jgi:hypothetical protein